MYLNHKILNTAFQLFREFWRSLQKGRRSATALYGYAMGAAVAAFWTQDGKRKRPPVEYAGVRKKVVWAQPTTMAEIEYRAWTHEGKLRQASFKGLRELQDNAAVFRIDG